MDNYKKQYFFLFNQITDALQALEARNYGQAEQLLKQAQIDAEELCMEPQETE